MGAGDETRTRDNLLGRQGLFFESENCTVPSSTAVPAAPIPLQCSPCLDGAKFMVCALVMSRPEMRRIVHQQTLKHGGGLSHLSLAGRHYGT